MPATDEWSIDEETEAVEGVKFLGLMLKQAANESYFWKWVVVAMHNAVHASFVLALKGTWPVDLLPDQVRMKVLSDQHNLNFDFRVYEAKIAPFLELYKRVQNTAYMRRSMYSKPLPADLERDSSIEWLNKTRNEFIHTRSMSYLRDVSSYPSRLLHALSVVEFLVHDSGNVYFFDDEDVERIQKELANIRKSLKAMNDSIPGEPCP